MDLKKIKAAFFDMDGTIISFTTHKISDRDIDAINKLRASGVKIFISSGRDKSNIITALNHNGLEVDGYVGLNGNLNVYNGKVISQYFMDSNDIKFIIDSLDSLDFALSLFTEDGIILNKIDDMVHNVHDYVEVPIPRVKSFDSVDINRIFQMNSYTRKSFDDKYLTKYMPHSVFKRWNDDFADINNASTSKLVGINDIINHLGIDISETISFGDSQNDLEMIQGTGVSVAMGNASDEIKNAATFTTKDCDESGVAHFIEKNFL